MGNEIGCNPQRFRTGREAALGKAKRRLNFDVFCGRSSSLLFFVGFAYRWRRRDPYLGRRLFVGS